MPSSEVAAALGFERLVVWKFWVQNIGSLMHEKMSSVFLVVEPSKIILLT